MNERISYTKTEKLLLEAARIFNSTLDYEELIERVLRLVMGAVDAEAALVFRVDHRREDIHIRYLKMGDERMSQCRRYLNENVVGWSTRFQQSSIVNNADEDERIDREIEKLSGIKFKNLLVVPLIGKGQLIGVVEAINKYDGEFTEEDLDILTGLNNQIAVAIDNARLYRDVRREALEKDLLYELGKKLSGSLKLSEVLKAILTSLKQVVEYDAGGIFLLDPKHNEIRPLYTVGYAPEYENKIQTKADQGLVGAVATSNEAVVVPDVSKDSRYIDANPPTKSEIAVPILVDDRLIGVVNLESEKPSAFNQDSLKLIAAFATQAAISIERAQLHEKILDANKLEEQLNVARIIQSSFLPQKQFKLAGYDLSGTNIPSEQVGGDYYDFIRIFDNQTGVVIGDVSGKGVPAGLIMASFRASLIAEIRNNYSIRTICKKVNTLLCESVEPGNFVTAVYGVLDSRNHIFTFANCGHDLPILVRNDGTVEYLRDGGPVFGIDPESAYEERAVYLNPGDVIVLYTDGVSETFDEAREAFGLKRIEKIILENKNKSAKEIQKAILSKVRKFASKDHVYDDLTIVAFKRSE